MKIKRPANKDELRQVVVAVVARFHNVDASAIADDTKLGDSGLEIITQLLY